MNYYPSERKTAILPRIANREAKAVEDCIQQYGNLVWLIVRKYVTSNEDAEDAVQDIFLAIWQNAGRYDETKGAETTFISMIARRRLIDRLRKTYRQPSFQSLTDVFEKQTNSIESRLETKIQAKRAFREVQNLRAEERDLILLSTCEGMSHGEIAEKTGMPLGTVKTNIRRGFDTLREVFGQKRAVAHESNGRSKTTRPAMALSKMILHT